MQTKFNDLQYKVRKRFLQIYFEDQNRTLSKSFSQEFFFSSCWMNRQKIYTFLKKFTSTITSSIGNAYISLFCQILKDSRCVFSLCISWDVYQSNLERISDLCQNLSGLLKSLCVQVKHLISIASIFNDAFIFNFQMRPIFFWHVYVLPLDAIKVNELKCLRMIFAVALTARRKKK